MLAAERERGRVPREMPHTHPGYDIESLDPATGRLYFIEVKGKTAGKRVITVSRTQILTALNKPDDFLLAIVEVDGERVSAPRYLRRPFHREPDFAAAGVNYDLDELFAHSEPVA